MEDNRKAYRVLVVKPEGKKPLGGTRRKWKDNIKLSFKAIECEGMNFICRRAGEGNRGMHLRASCGCGNFLAT